MREKFLVEKENLGQGFAFDGEEKKINIAIDGDTVNFNSKGQLVATVKQNITNVTELSASQFIEQINDFAFIQLSEKPSFQKGLPQYKIEEVTGYRNITVRGAGERMIGLNKQNSGVIFKYPKDIVGIVDLSCDVFETTNTAEDKNTKLSSWAATHIEVLKEMSFISSNNEGYFDENGQRCAVWFQVILRSHNLPKDVEKTFRMQYKVRVMVKV